MLLAALALTGCQPPDYDIIPRMMSGALTFEARNPGLWPLKWDDDEIDAHYLEVVTADRILWAVTSKTEDASCLTATPNPEYKEPAHLAFPLRYGVAPRCFRLLKRAEAVPADVPTMVRTSGLQNGQGTFAIRGGGEVRVLEGGVDFDDAPTLNPYWMPLDPSAGRVQR